MKPDLFAAIALTTAAIIFVAGAKLDPGDGCHCKQTIQHFIW
jgi:hypothetical protein